MFDILKYLQDILAPMGAPLRRHYWQVQGKRSEGIVHVCVIDLKHRNRRPLISFHFSQKIIY